MLTGLVCQLLSMGVVFACRTFFAQLLAKEYLGLSGLFSNIIAVLSLSELGLGSVIIVNLYKPLAEDDKIQVCKLMNFYRQAYHLIGLFVICCGIVLVPFVKYLVKAKVEIPYLELYFMLFILQSATSYFFSYKQSILIASQNEYICTIIRQFFNILLNVLQIIFLFLTRNYMVYLLIAIFTSLGTNIVLSMVVDQKFSYLKENRKILLHRKEKNELFKNVSSMMLHKIGNVTTNATSNILISSMMGIAITGLYSNYSLLINVLLQIVTIIFGSVSASIGDFNARESGKELNELYNALNLFSYWIFGVSSICMFSLIQPTIKLWLGEDFLLDQGCVLLIVVNYFLNGIFRVPATFVDVSGLYTRTKFKPVSMAAINLISAIILLKLCGLPGVFLGTLISYISVAIWVDPYFLYKYRFKASIMEYWKKLFLALSTTVIVGGITYYAMTCMPNYILKVLVVAVLSNFLFMFVYFKAPEFQYVWHRLKPIISKIKS